MQVILALLCDYANVSREGKLNIMGIFDTINSSTMPARHASMSLVMRFRVMPSEFGRPQRLAITLLDEDGQKVFEIGSEIKAEGKGAFPAHLDQVVALTNLVFPKAGSYSFSILINDNEAESVPLQIIKVDPPAGLSGPTPAG